MKRFKMSTRTAAFLMIITSAILYGLDYFFVGQFRPIVEGLLGNLAFLPVYVLFVTLMIERVIRERERLALRQKLNMVIGVFFSEVGSELMRNLTDFLHDSEELERRLKVRPQWGEKDFLDAAAFIAKYDIKFDSRMGDLGYLRVFLLGKREFMLRLLENPNLLEHDEFTDLVWAVFHMVDELASRQQLGELPQSDLEHLAGDMKRAFGHLLREWIYYMKHLKEDYPYLFSLAVRMNPLDPEARAEIY